MLRSHLMASWRNLWRHKGFSLLNISGLTLGLTVFLLLAQYAQYEWSFDQFHQHKDELYRITLEQYLNNELIHASAENYPALGPTLVEEFPEVEAYTRLYNLGAKNNIVVTREDVSDRIAFKQRKLLYASEDFLTIFSYPVLRGDPETALAEPFKMVISQRYAEQYFGSEDPIGKQLRMQDDDFNNELCEVTAVVKVPNHTHLRFDILISYSTLYARYDGSERARARYDQSWERKDMYTYIKTIPGTDPQVLSTRFPDLINRNIPDLAGQNRRDVLQIQPVTDIHLYSNLNDEPSTPGNGRAVSFLAMIALFVLLVAYINYINLATARSAERANEVGVRKVLGASPGQLVKQFLLDAMIMNGFSIVLAVALYLILFPAFATLTGILSEGNYWDHLILFQPSLMLIIAGLLVVGTLLSGLYPALVLSQFRPARILGNAMISGSDGNLLRKSLVVLQFSICIGLIIGTIVVLKQMKYLQQQDLGFNPSQIIVVEQPSVFNDFQSRMNSVRTFKNSLRAEPQISHVMSTLVIPGKKVRWKADLHRLGQSEAESHVFNYNLVDEAFFPGFGMEMIAGRNFSADIPTDADTACVITEMGAQVLGYDQPSEAIGQVVQSGDGLSAIIVGVVNDYHQESLHEEIQPTVFFLNDYAEYYLMRIKNDQIPKTLATVERQWQLHFPGNPFEYFFMDDHFNAQYENDRRFQKLFSFFSILAIALSCLGLFGLSAYVAQRRSREVSIRKVLGASTAQLILMLTSDFAKLILLANIIAWPMIGWLMQDWLAGFATRTTLSWWIFAASALLVLLLGILTVTYHAFRAANLNPSVVLSSE